jgi:hypothetical protein
MVGNVSNNHPFYVDPNADVIAGVAGAAMVAETRVASHNMRRK